MYFCLRKWRETYLRDPTEFIAIVIMIIVNCMNVVLVGMKLVAAYFSGSFSISNSTIESFGDVFTGALILTQRIQSHFVRKDKFPRGKNTSALSNVVCAVVMVVLALVNALLCGDRYLNHKFDPHLDVYHVSVIIFNIFVKLLLFVICYLKREVGQVKVLMKDQITDVATNGCVLFFAVLTIYFNIIWDAVGAIIILFVIMSNWFPILFINCNKIHGVIPSKTKRELVDQMINRSGFALNIEEKKMYHRGEHIVVEMHTKGLTSEQIKRLRKKVESLDIVDYALVFENEFLERTKKVSVASTLQMCDEETESMLELNSRLSHSEATETVTLAHKKDDIPLLTKETEPE